SSGSSRDSLSRAVPAARWPSSTASTPASSATLSQQRPTTTSAGDGAPSVADAASCPKGPMGVENSAVRQRGCEAVRDVPAPPGHGGGRRPAPHGGRPGHEPVSGLYLLHT